MKVLIVGSGGREHALAWALSRSAQVQQIYVAPGNAGTEQIAVNLPVMADDLDRLRVVAQEKVIDLTIVGPEVPLAAGIVDRFQEVGLTIFGPSQAAAQLESSKAFAKAFMRKHGIPTAAYATFDNHEAAQTYLAQQGGLVVIKASGLAAGKGVIVCDDHTQAQAALSEIMVARHFGAAGDQVVIEERLQGPEVSLLAFSDGQTVVPMLPARDHKRAYDQDHGPNTGGMGAFTPPPDVDQSLIDQIMTQVLIPTVEGMAERGTPYVGVLYAGLMLTAAGPKVLEFNCRFGDPETQVILPMLKGDLAEIMLACIHGCLHPELVQQQAGACATVVMASHGYPGSYNKGLPITGLDEAATLPKVTVFHAGTKMDNGHILTNGGRVLAVSAVGPDLETAVARAYTGVDKIHFEKAHYRKDIGLKGV